MIAVKIAILIVNFPSLGHCYEITTRPLHSLMSVLGYCGNKAVPHSELPGRLPAVPVAIKGFFKNTALQMFC